MTEKQADWECGAKTHARRLSASDPRLKTQTPTVCQRLRQTPFMVGANEIRFSVAQVDDVALTIWRQGLEDVQLFRAQRAKRHAARQKGTLAAVPHHPCSCA